MVIVCNKNYPIIQVNIDETMIFFFDKEENCLNGFERA